MKKKGPEFIIDVVPLVKIPLIRDQSFFYLSDKKLAAGTLVEIPLFHGKTQGVVIGTKSNFQRLGNIRLKKLDKILEESFLTYNQLKLANFISKYYFSPLGIVMKSFVPKRVKLRKSQRQSNVNNKSKKKIVLTDEQKKAIDKILENSSQKKYLLFGPSGSGKTEVYIHAISKLKKGNEEHQFLVLVPEKTLTPQAVDRYRQYFKPEEIVVLNSNLSGGQFFTNWQRILSGEAKIIIGTRMAISAPFRRLGLIIVDEEQDISFKQWDMNPRYDARLVAEKMSEIYGCRIIFGSATPRLESYFKAKSDGYKLLELPRLSVSDTKQPLPETVLVDMKKERWQKNYSPISRKLQSEIAYALKNKLQTILFINRQGMSAFSICDSCRTVLRCPKCDRALIYDDRGIYRCPHCSYKTSITPQCSKCHGVIFKNIGLGTQKVEKETLFLFPEAKVSRIDAQLVQKARNYQEKTYRDFSEGKIDILVGTQMISKGWDLPRVALIGIIDADNALFLPDFRSNEKVFEDIVQVSGRVARPGAKYPGSVVIQTFQPENKTLKLAAQRDFEAFYSAEIGERKSLGLPPFGKLIKLVFRDYNSTKTEKEAQRIAGVLENITGIKVSEAQDPMLPKIRGRFQKHIIIKIRKEIPRELELMLCKLGSGWIIDIDPISII